MTDDLNVQLFRDFNGNGSVDGKDKQIAISDRLRLDEVINLSSEVADIDTGKRGASQSKPCVQRYSIQFESIG